MKSNARKFFEFYKRHIPEILLAVIVFTLTASTQDIPYLNILIVSFNPVLTGVIAVWIVFYFVINPPVKKIFIWALLIFLANFVFVVFHRERIGELIASLSYAMFFTAVIAEISEMKNKLKNDSSNV